MSGVLSSLTGVASGGLVGSVLGLLRTASWRGVSFDMLDSTHSAGRRVHRFLFPGRDDTIHEDLGAIDGPIQISGLHVGDDYVRWQRRMEKACKEAGPGTLRHPWLGPLRVVLSEPASFKFEDKQLRVCTVTLTFEIWQERPTQQLSTIGGLLDALDDVLDQAREIIADALGPLADALGVLSLLQGAMAFVAGTFGGLLGSGLSDGSLSDGSLSGSSLGSGFGGAGGANPAALAAASVTIGDDGTLAAAAAAPIDRLGGGVALDPSNGSPALADQVASLMLAVPAALSAVATVRPDPAIGPGPVASAAAPADPRRAAATLLAALPLLVPPPGALPLTVTVLTAARIQVLAEAARVGAATRWTSRDEALAWRGKLLLAASVLAADLARAAALRPLGAGPAWRAVLAVQAAVVRDLTERSGRLPAVRHLVTLQTLSAWQIALAVAGDNPASIRPTMLDLVDRNRIRHPGLVPPGRLEVLVT